MTHPTSDQCIPLPEIYTRRMLNALYRQIPLKDTTFRLLRKYFIAAANLYGAVPVRKVFEIVSAHYQGLVSMEDFARFAEIACHECEEYYILGDSELYEGGRRVSILDKEILDVSLLNGGGERYAFLKQMQYGKPYYVPPKTVFSSYAEPFYWEPSAEADALRAFLKTEFVLSDARLEQVYTELVYGTRYLSVPVMQAVYRLQDMGLNLPEEQEKTFISVFLPFRNQVRMQGNRGYTPLEIREIQSAIAPTQKKVGRNDPCPCGSGKKYKNCCGK